MSAVFLNWRTLAGSNNPKFLHRGTELSVAIFGRHSRFAAYEVRTFDGVEYDREYVVRDADGVSDDDLRSGKRPPVVGRTDSYDRLLAFVAKSRRAR